jgi:choline dehydrogenase-like flavoprotein
VPILTDRERAVLASLCDTFVPALEAAEDPHGFFADHAGPATLERVERMIGRLGDSRARGQLRLLLAVLDSALANLLTAGRPWSFTRMSRASRERLLLSWARSPLQLRRAGFQALKRLILVAHYGWPSGDGPHPAWRQVGYPGPLPLPESLPAPLPTVVIDRDATLDCDVVVVGAGAGGGVVAGVLADAGRSVVVLDKGPNPDPAGFTQIEGEMLHEYYLDHGLLMTQNGSMPILAGSGLGGGTVINYTTSFALPEATRQEWDRISGVRLFTSTRFQESFERVSARLDVGTLWSTPGPRDAILERGARALGWHVGVMPRNVTACREGLECGYCGYGCRHGAKNSTAATYLADAAHDGARLVASCEALRILVERGRAVGVAARVRRDGAPPASLTVRARAVVVACGAIHTPALLARSGLTNRHIGRGLRLHPATAMVGVFPERVEPWSGSLQARYSDQFADMENGYGVKFETAPMHLALPASAFGWDGAPRFKEDLARLGYTGLCGVLLRDRDPGRVVTGRDGRPRVHYEVSDWDLRHAARGLKAAAELLAAAGATQLFSLQQPPVRTRPGGTRWLDRFAIEMDRRGYGRCRMAFITFHQMASCAMGSDPRRGAIGEMGESFEVGSLYVADGSAFPTSSGVNPMLTIMAIADHVARGMLE